MLLCRAAPLPIPPSLQLQLPTSLYILCPSPCTLWWAAHLPLYSITHLLLLQPQPRIPLHLPASWGFTLQSRVFWRTPCIWPAPTGTFPACPARAHSASLCPPLPPHCTAYLWTSEQDCLKTVWITAQRWNSTKMNVKRTAKLMAGASTCTYCKLFLPCKLLLFLWILFSAFIAENSTCTWNFFRVRL